MPRYVIEMDEPTDCSDCPCFSEYYNVDFCELAKNDSGERCGRPIDGPEPWVWPRPDWCPLVRLD